MFYYLQEAHYARWMAACRMAAKGKTMADSGYDYEVKSIQVIKHSFNASFLVNNYLMFP